MIRSRTDKPDDLSNIASVLALQAVLEFSCICSQLENGRLKLRERDCDRVDAGDCVHQVMGLVNDNNMVFNGKIQGFPGRSLKQQWVWKGYNLYPSLK